MWEKKLLRKLLKQRNVNVISRNSVKAFKSKNYKNDKKKRDRPSRKLKLSRKVILPLEFIAYGRTTRWEYAYYGR